MTTARREEILAAALAVFAERGYRGASIDAVAERAGLTRQGVLHYFPSKKRLLVALLELREELAREHLAADHADKDIPSQLAEVVAYDHLNPGLAQIHSVLVAEGMAGSDQAQQYCHDRNQAIQEHTTAYLTKLYGDRLPSGLTPRAAATALVVMLDGMHQQWLLDGEQSDYPEITRDVVAVLLGSTPV
ncbi:TetR/AcrR family transcriptional regulator [Streptomyces sp. NBC_01615]|uniref:TetR/AcrR family transcriptional regulator n=1 Tax=Streptomyces sp. NBC_01615 TaxID=2975898 RepID=UPI0038681C27